MNERSKLCMRKTDLDKLPPFMLPAGYGLHTHIEGNERAWEKLIEKAFNIPYTFEEAMIGVGDYSPEHILYISKDGKDIATATAIEFHLFPGEGLFHMIATDPEARGLGAGRLACEAALHQIAARGFKTAVLRTDDERLPAIKLYLSLGFVPFFVDDTQEERWNKIYEKLGVKK